MKSAKHYGQSVIKTCKTFLAAYRPAGGLIRVRQRGGATNLPR
ncbi:MAG TPA: hypothetical protein VGN42_03475 [Pirellulales bacterium]|nr:hypothetical protein [Pirellulales bacterium]